MKNKKILLLLVIFLIFIGLGLPDALLGSSWNLIRLELNVPLGYIGFTTVTTFIFTILTTYFAPRLLARFQTKQIVLVSLILTSTALIAMSFQHSYALFVLFAIPLGIGAGAIDFSINHYVVLHYKASHLNYLHSFYGVGVLIGPLVMAITLKQEIWRIGYIIIGSIMMIIVTVILLSWKMWFQESDQHKEEHHSNISTKDVLRIKGVPLSVLIFLVYVHIESLFGVFIASYFYIAKNESFSNAAMYTLFYYIGLASGRVIGGFISDKLHPNTILKSSVLLMSVGILCLLLNVPIQWLSLLIVFLIGFGSGPVFPNMIHMNDKNFEKRYMSKIMSLQMTIAYVSFGVLTPLMGFFFQWTTISYYPIVVTILVLFLTTIVFRFSAYQLHMKHSKQ